MTLPVPVPVSQFPNAALPLTGDELVPIIKDGVTSKVPSSAFTTFNSSPTPEGELIALAGNNPNVDVRVIRWLFVDTSAGDATITSFLGGTVGLILVITNIGPNQLGIEGAGILGLSGLTLPANASQLLYFSETLNKWVLV